MQASRGHLKVAIKFLGVPAHGVLSDPISCMLQHET